MSEKTSIDYITPHWHLGCDQWCKECYVGARDRTISTPLAERIRAIDTLMSYNPKQFYIAGGNPTIDPYIEQTVAELKKRGIKVGVTSNSWALPHIKNLAEFLNNVDDRMATFYSNGAEMHDALCGSKGSFNRLKNNISNLSSQGYSFIPIINIMPQNNNKVYDIIKGLQEFINFDKVLFQRIMPSGSALEHNNLYLNPDDFKNIFKQFAQAKDDFNLTEISSDMPAPPCLVGDNEFMDNYSFGISYFPLDWKGRLFASSFDLMQPKFALFGGKPVWEVRGDLITQIDADPVIKEYREKKYLPAKCKKCSKYENCFGGFPIRGADGKIYMDRLLTK